MGLWAGEKREIVTDLQMIHYDCLVVCRNWFCWEAKPRASQAWGQVEWNVSPFAMFSSPHQVPGLPDFSTVVVNERCCPLVVAGLEDMLQHQPGHRWLGA